MKAGSSVLTRYRSKLPVPPRETAELAVDDGAVEDPAAEGRPLTLTVIPVPLRITATA